MSQSIVRTLIQEGYPGLYRGLGVSFVGSLLYAFQSWPPYFLEYLSLSFFAFALVFFFAVVFVVIMSDECLDQ